MNQRVVMIIQARMGSTRLPGKSMMNLAGAPLVGRILERVKRCSKVDEIVLAIPNTIEDQILADVAKQYGVNVFSGPRDDLVERYYQAARLSNASLIVRLPADNATPEPSEIDRIIDYHKTLGRRGFSSNLAEISGSEYPDGIGAEVFDFSLLEEARSKYVNGPQREHVHLNFFDYSSGKAVDSNWCPVNTLKCPESFRRPDLVLDVNTHEQYVFMSQLYEYLYPLKNNFHITDTIDWYDNIYLKSKNHKES